MRSQFQSLHDRIGGIDLNGIRIRLAVEIGDAYLRGVAVVVDDGLLTEMGVIVLSRRAPAREVTVTLPRLSVFIESACNESLSCAKAVRHDIITMPVNINLIPYSDFLILI